MKKGTIEKGRQWKEDKQVEKERKTEFPFFFIFSRVVFRAVPWLTERLEEANDKLYCTAQQTISKPQMAANNNTFIIYIAKPLGNVKV